MSGLGLWPGRGEEDRVVTVARGEPGKTQIGWIGTGVMGSSMCGHLMEAGFSITVHNRTREKAQALLDRGADN